MPKTKDWSGYATPSDGEDEEAGANGPLIYNNVLMNIPEKPLMGTLDEIKMISYPPRQPHDAYTDEERYWVPATLPSCVPRPKSTVAQQSSHWSEVIKEEPAATEPLLPPSANLGGHLPADIDLGPKLEGQSSTQGSILGNNTSESFLHTQMLEDSLSSFQMAPSLNSQFNFRSQTPLSMPTFELTVS